MRRGAGTDQRGREHLVRQGGIDLPGRARPPDRAGLGRSDAEQTEWAGRSTTGPAHRCGDGAVPGRAEQADRQVAQGGHHPGAVPGTDLAGVLAEGHVADPVQAVLDLPLAADQPKQPGRVGLGGGQAGDAVGQFGEPWLAAQVGDTALDHKQLGKVREGDALGWAGGLDSAPLDPPVAAVSLGVRRGKTPALQGG